MLFIFLGTSCSGKSSAAEELKKLTNASIYSGKDYLRLAKNEKEAWNLFKTKLIEAKGKGLNEESIIYVVSDKNVLPNINDIDGAVKIRFMADLETLKTRFAKRTGGKLAPPIEKMLERQMTEWDGVNGDISFDTSEGISSNDIAAKILEYCS
ncbi:hypothetical protein Q428_14555 [Fervidicella metallireducens AeB]|uniref:Adenylylsulfate kinase n=1 Tax=Fervidicella metallireducens AeB TaxID=1403537 RepID=A0A017RRJ2_9CLOT|nr:hypothetical protein [Fervidicella metallireducens]EYE87216.1 hypothetical protein Q428_14555 [Fervidicella metallireducens AeB]